MIPRLCTFPGCDRLLEARGFCKGHYEQRRLHRPLVELRAYRTDPLSDVQVNEAKRLYGEGMTLRELAARYGVSHPTVMLALKAEGVVFRSRGGAHKPRVDLPREAFTDPVWGTRAFALMMSKAPRWSGKAGSYS